MIVPVSKFKRELNKWLRYIDKYPNNKIIISRNGCKVAVMVSPEIIGSKQSTYK